MRWNMSAETRPFGPTTRSSDFLVNSDIHQSLVITEEDPIRMRDAIERLRAVVEQQRYAEPCSYDFPVGELNLDAP